MLSEIVWQLIDVLQNRIIAVTRKCEVSLYDDDEEKKCDLKYVVASTFDTFLIDKLQSI